MTKNYALMRKILEQIDAEPASWDQAMWATRTSESSCGTAMCFAGWAAALSGATMLFDGGYTTTRCVTVNNGERSISMYAEEVLGLTDAEADAMFFALNNREDFDRMIRGWAWADDQLREEALFENSIRNLRASVSTREDVTV